MPESVLSHGVLHSYNQCPHPKRRGKVRRTPIVVPRLSGAYRVTLHIPKKLSLGHTVFLHLFIGSKIKTVMRK